MSNILINIRYFQVPQAITTMKLLQQLTGNELALYIYLCSEAQRTSRGTLTASGESLALNTGISISKVGTARLGLREYRMIETTRVGRGHRYTLCDPANGLPIQPSCSADGSLDFDQLTTEQLRRYFLSHLKGTTTDTVNGLTATCPFHDDASPSLSVSLRDGGAWNCHGCGEKGRLIQFETAIAKHQTGLEIDGSMAHKRIMDALRAAGAVKSATGQPEAIYIYRDDMGDIAYEVLRYPGKRFSQRRPNPKYPGSYIYSVKGRPTLLYHLDEVRDADTVFVVEGEKDCDAVRSLQINDDTYRSVTATTNSGGAGNWTSEHSKQMKGKRAILIADNDPKGRQHMSDVAVMLNGIADDVCQIELPPSFKDVSEFLAVHGVKDLIKLMPRDWLADITEV